MPKILITGNGFDLSFGLPTSYKDFISILNYIEHNSHSDFESIYSCCSDYNTIISNFNHFNIEEQKINDLRKYIGNNLWYNFFRDELEIETWIDFEVKIEYVLRNLFSSVEHIKTKIFSKGVLNENKPSYRPELFNNNIEIIQVLNRFNIIDLYDNYNFELNVDFLIKKYQFYIDIDLNKIAKHLYRELLEFKNIFNLYFEIFVFPFYDNLKIKVDRTLFANINKHYTFNYTPTFEKIYKKDNLIKFLHGKINSISDKIVLGISDIPEDNIDKKYFLPFTKYFQKLNNNTDFVFIKEFEKKINVNYSFFFMGHSLDKSDEDYINEVFDFILKLTSKMNKIVIIYHNELSKSNLLINLLNIRGKTDVQNLMKSNILVFKEMNSIELKRELNRDISNTVPSLSVYQ